MTSMLVDYFLQTKGLVSVDEAEAGNRSKLNLKRLGMDQLPPKLIQMNEAFHRNLTKLFLQNNSLSSLPDAMGEFLPRLRVLCLDYNRIGKLPVTLPLMNRLTKLNISHNPLKRLPEVIFALSNLKELWANSIEMMWELEIPPEIGKLGKLRVLGLRNNRIDYLPQEFSSLKSLIRVSLSGNLFKSIPPLLFDLPTLVHLNLDDNQVQELLSISEEESGKSLVKAQELRYLRLCNNFIPVTTKVCNKFKDFAPKLAWCLLDGNPCEQSPSKTFKGFFKPESYWHAANSPYDQTTSTSEEEEPNNDSAESESMLVVTSNDRIHPPQPPQNADAGVPLSPTTFTTSTTTSTTFFNLHANNSSCLSSTVPDEIISKDQNDGKAKSTKQLHQHQQLRDENNRERTKGYAKSRDEKGLQLPSVNEEQEEASDNAASSTTTKSSTTTWTYYHYDHSGSESESCASVDYKVLNNIPIRTIDIDESFQNTSDEETWKDEQLNFPDFQKSCSKSQKSDVSALASHTGGVENHIQASIKVVDTKEEIRPAKKDEMESSTLLSCMLPPEMLLFSRLSKPVVAKDLIENTFPILSLPPHDNNSASRLSKQNVNRISKSLSGVVGREGEEEWKLGLSPKSCSALLHNFPCVPATTTPQSGVGVLLGSQLEYKPQIWDSLFEKVMQKAAKKQALNCEDEGHETVDPQGSSSPLSCSQSIQNKEPYIFNFINGKKNQDEDKHQEHTETEISCSTRCTSSQVQVVGGGCATTEEIPEKICKSIPGIQSLTMRDHDEIGEETNLECDKNLNLPALKEWTWHCDPVQKVKNWINSTSSSKSAIKGASFQFHKQNTTSHASHSKEECQDNSNLECRPDDDEQQLVVNNVRSLSCNYADSIHSRLGNEPRKRKHIKFSDTNTYFPGPEQQDLEILKDAANEQSTQDTTNPGQDYYDHSSSWETESSHSVQMIFTSKNQPDSQSSAPDYNDDGSVASAITQSPNFSHNLPRRNFSQQTSNPNICHNPPSAMTLLHDFLNLDSEEEENEESFFERIDTALELDNSDLEYSPASSDIDVDDEDSDSVNWERDFVLRQEDFNIILRPVL